MFTTCFYFPVHINLMLTSSLLTTIWVLNIIYKTNTNNSQYLSMIMCLLYLLSYFYTPLIILFTMSQVGVEWKILESLQVFGIGLWEVMRILIVLNLDGKINRCVYLGLIGLIIFMIEFSLEWKAKKYIEKLVIYVYFSSIKINKLQILKLI